MEILITSRHFKASEQLKKLINSKLNKLSKFNNDIINFNVILDKQNNYEKVEIMTHIHGRDFIAIENQNNFEQSVINAVEKISIQIKKYSDKIKNIQR